MKQLLFVLAACALLAGSITAQAKKTKAKSKGGKVAYTKLEQYFVKNNYSTGKDWAALQFGSQEDLDMTYGFGAINGDNSANFIDFNTHYAIGIIGEASETQYDVVIKSFVKSGNELVLTYAIKAGDKLSYSSRPHMLIKVARTEGTKVKFVRAK